MKKNRIVFFRVTFVILAMLTATFFSLRFYYQYTSQQGIKKSLQIEDTPIIGNKNNPFTIVEFFDYRCPHCSTLYKITQDSIGQDIDKTTKVLLRPVVVSDADSYKIALLVLAADGQKQGETIALHRDIMALPSIPTYDTVKAMAVSHGIDVARAEVDGEKFKPVIIKNTKLLADIGFYGVPALVIGDKGYIPRAQMPGINELKLMMLDAKTRLKILPPTGLPK
jgi:protein-disulfide isomerase